MTYDRHNAIVAAIAAVLLAVVVAGALALTSRSADRVRIEHEQTEQARVAACEHIEAPEVAALCIAAVKP